jgi:phosphatidylinositol alpha-1,6-mannosyltransferase
MTALLITEIFPPQTGGSGRWFWEIYRRMPRDQVIVAAGEFPGAAEFDDQHDVRVVRVPLSLPSWGVLSPSGMKNYWRAVRRLTRIAQSGQVNQIHCGRCLPEGLMARMIQWRTGLPFICYSHGEELKYAASSRELTWLARRVLRRAEFVIANSTSTRRILTDGWRVSPDRIRLMHPGVDTRQFTPAARDAGVRARLGWGDRPVVLTVGRLQKRKGHDTLIRALPAIRRRVPDVLYAIIGDGEERAALEELAKSQGQVDSVRFHGEMSDADLAAAYQQCDLFVLANRQVGQDIEGFGMVLVEAQACGKPVIAGTSGGTAETMRIPETGCVVNCDGPDELASAVCELLLDPARRAHMGRAARTWVEEKFDWESLSRDARAVFSEIPSRFRQNRRSTLTESPAPIRE